MNGRNTERQKKILELLSGSDYYIHVGAQPYTPSDVNFMLEMSSLDYASTNSVRRTLKLLAKKGLVRVERKKSEVYTGMGIIKRDLDHYWNVETEKEDSELAKDWNDGKEERSRKALEKFFS